MDTLTVPELRLVHDVLEHQEDGTPIDPETLERGTAILATWTHGKAG